MKEQKSVVFILIVSKSVNLWNRQSVCLLSEFAVLF